MINSIREVLMRIGQLVIGSTAFIAATLSSTCWSQTSDKPISELSGKSFYCKGGTDDRIEVTSVYPVSAIINLYSSIRVTNDVFDSMNGWIGGYSFFASASSYPDFFRFSKLHKEARCEILDSVEKAHSVQNRAIMLWRQRGWAFSIVNLDFADGIHRSASTPGSGSAKFPTARGVDQTASRMPPQSANIPSDLACKGGCQPSSHPVLPSRSQYNTPLKRAATAPGANAPIQRAKPAVENLTRCLNFQRNPKLPEMWGLMNMCQVAINWVGCRSNGTQQSCGGGVAPAGGFSGWVVLIDNAKIAEWRACPLEVVVNGQKQRTLAYRRNGEFYCGL